MSSETVHPGQESLGVRVTNAVLERAIRFDRRYGLGHALGLTEPYDRLAAAYAIARSLLGSSIRELTHSGGNQKELDLQRYAARGIDEATELLRQRYPAGSNRPAHIQQAVNEVLTQAELPKNQRIFRTRGSRRRLYQGLAAEWQGKLARSR
jgi:hypothetical protein